MEIFWTVISGVSIFVLGQIIQVFVLKPLNDFKVVLGEISHKVKFHSNIITNSGMKERLVEWSSKDMRDLSCQLESKYLIIPFNKWLPMRRHIREAAKLLILLSNTSGKKGYETKNDDTIRKLKRELKIIL